ncbi:LON peptidase substrate-binding domain-containing protein [soil metagenome]
MADDDVTPPDEPRPDEAPGPDDPPGSGDLPDDLAAMEADLLDGGGEGVMAMFPLGSVLVPTMVLPLHVFEHRYRRLVRDCAAGAQEFGVVLIERGREIGGGDVRSDVGTVARMVRAAELPDGRFALECVGTRRIRVLRWLEDAPYPRAEVEDWPDELGPAGVDPAALREMAVERLRRGLELQIGLGEAGPDPSIELSEDPETASHQVAAVAPIGPHDRQKLLAAAGTVDRLLLADSLLADAVELLEARRDMG